MATVNPPCSLQRSRIHHFQHQLRSEIIQMSSRNLPIRLIVCEFCDATFTRQVDANANRHYDSQHNPLLDAVCPGIYEKPASEFPERQQWFPRSALVFLTGSPHADNGPSSVNPQLSQDGHAEASSANLYDLTPATDGDPPLYTAYSSNHNFNNSYPNISASTAPAHTGSSTSTGRTVTRLNSSDTADGNMADGNTANENMRNENVDQNHGFGKF